MPATIKPATIHTPRQSALILIAARFSPRSSRYRGVPRVDDRRVLNGIFWVLRSGAPWRDLPERYGPRTTCYNRFNRWREAGVWDRLMDAISAAHDGEIQMIDSTSIRAHQQAATAKKGVQIIVSVAVAAGLRPRSTSSSTRRASRSGSA